MHSPQQQYYIIIVVQAGALEWIDGTQCLQCLSIFVVKRARPLPLGIRNQPRVRKMRGNNVQYMHLETDRMSGVPKQGCEREGMVKEHVQQGSGF